MSEAIWQWFSQVMKSQVKIMAKSSHDWQEIGIHGNPYIILFLHAIFYVMNTQIW